MISTKPGIFEKLLRFSFLVAGAGGFLRLYGTIQQYPDILNFSQHAWLPIYLAAAGSLMGLLNLAIWIMLGRNYKAAAWLPWAGVLMNIAAYWLERLLLWAPEQRGTNALWSIGVHATWLLLAGLSRLQMKRRNNEHE